jgi:hypothetical protein
MINQNENQKENKKQETKGDKNSPMASAGESNREVDSERIKRTASDPGGAENAAGTSQKSKEKKYKARIGSGPVPNDKINKGEG